MRILTTMSCLLLVIVVGCSGSGSGKPRVPTIPVSGKLQMDGKPFGPCTITFQPNPLTKDGKSPLGNVKKDGTFELRTYVAGDGAPEGNYDVLLLPDAMEGPPVPMFKPKAVEVKKPGSGKLQINIDLESTGPAKMELPPTNTTPT